MYKPLRKKTKWCQLEQDTLSSVTVPRFLLYLEVCCSPPAKGKNIKDDWKCKLPRDVEALEGKNLKISKVSLWASSHGTDSIMKRQKSLDKTGNIFEKFLPFFFFSFLGLHSRHMEVPRLGVQLELKPPAYVRAIAMPDSSHVCNPHHSSGQCRILNPLIKAKDGTHNVMVPSWIC